MINSSPIDTWDAAGAIFTFAGTGGVVFWFIVMCALCIAPLYVSLRAENAVEKEYAGKK